MQLDMTNNDDYMIASALRGPDVYNDEGLHTALKFVTTAVIRHFVGMDDDNAYASVNTAEQAEWYLSRGYTLTLKDALIAFAKKQDHFMGHFTYALQILYNRGTPGVGEYAKVLVDFGFQSDRLNIIVYRMRPTEPDNGPTGSTGQS